MCRSAWTIIFLNFLALAVSTPMFRKKLTEEAETSLDRFLNLYLDQVEKVNGVPEDDLYETMQGDEPHEQNTIHQIGPNSNFGDNRNLTSNDYSRAVRNRLGENRKQLIKVKILDLIGRKPEDELPSGSLNITVIPNVLNITDISIDDQITEKIRSFYPSCEIPTNTDQDLWKDDDTMNLFFNFEFFTESKNANIATATLRLYRLPDNSTKPTNKPDCDNLTSTEEDRLLRVSIYWYTKSLKKRRVKRRLSDSKVISETSKWVELSVKAAAKAWARGRNLGMGILVEDQEGNTLKADRVFKGASCTVGISTPKPIPTIIVDAARQSNELDRIHSLFGRNSTPALHSDVHLLPTIDICTLEFPDNYTLQHTLKSRINACNLKKMYEQSQLLVAKDKLERLVTLPDSVVPSNRHIRHQRQHMATKLSEDNENRDYDIRSRIVGYKVVLRHEDMQNFTNNKFNFSMIHR